MRVGALMTGCRMRVDRQTAVHDARVQLCRLRQTDGKPDSDKPGQGPGKPVSTHGSNIDGKTLMTQYRHGGRQLGRGIRMGARNFSQCGDQLRLIFGEPLDQPTKRVPEPFSVD